MILGISGSPIQGGNTDRMVLALLEGSGKEHQFVNLSTLRFDPCRACAHLCARTNICPLEDDLRPYMEPILESEALVIGTPVHNGAMTAWLYSFISRIWCFYHVKDLLRGKPVVLVVTALFEENGKHAADHLAKYLNSWHSDSLNILGKIVYISQIPPCYRCGMGPVCQVGGLWVMVGQDEDNLKSFRLTKDLFRRWEDSPETVAEVIRYSTILAKLNSPDDSIGTPSEH